QREALRHVANASLDLVGVAPDVVAETATLSAIRCEQTAQHADSRGLAASVRPEEPVNRAPLHLHAEVMHHFAAIEGFRKPVHIDRDIGAGYCHRGHRLSATGVLAFRKTLIGCPTRKASGRDGRACTR